MKQPAGLTTDGRMRATLESLHQLSQFGERRLIRKAWANRIGVLATALRRPLPGTPSSLELRPGDLGRALAAAVRPTDPAEVWLSLAVMTGELPADAMVAEVAREAEFSGVEPLAVAIIRGTGSELAAHEVAVTAQDAVLVDVSATLRMPFTTGIQRVVRETAARWERDKGAIPVSWSHDFGSLRPLTKAELDRVRTREPAPRHGPSDEPSGQILVPWRATFLEPEVMAEVARSSQVRSLAQYARCRVAGVGYDCVPLTSSETLIDWGGDTFSYHLAALRHFDQVAAISEAAAEEFRGWRLSLGSTGRLGPAIDAVRLPVEMPAPSAEIMADARQRFVVGELPLVLVVGSAEPRKNHLAVLHAAERLWRAGLEFSLTFVGGRAWGGSAFAQQVTALQNAGRVVDVATGVDDDTLSAAYRLSRFTVFTSLNEGFGLPVAESLACGTPVLTSDYGSMHEIAEGGGALEVNPRSDAQIAEGMRRLLTDDGLVARLGGEAINRPTRTWDDYARETWRLLVDGGRNGQGVKACE